MAQECVSWSMVWFKSFLFVISVYQTAQFLTKFSKDPLTATYTRETLKGTPVVTVCPSHGGINFADAERSILRASFSKNGTIIKQQLLSKIHELYKFETLGLLADLNISIPEFLAEVRTPIFDFLASERNNSCFVELGAKEWACQPVISRMSPGIQSTAVAKTSPQLQLANPLSALEQFIMVHDLKYEALWKTNVLFVEGGISLCYTLESPGNRGNPQHNAKTNFQFRFHFEHPETRFRITNKDAQKQLLESLTRYGGFNVFLHLHGTAPPKFHDLVNIETYHVDLGQKATLWATVDQFHKVNSRSSPCMESHDAESARQFWANCVEDHFMPCRWVSTNSSRNLCKTPQDFKAYFLTLNKLPHRMITDTGVDEVVDVCPIPCIETTFNYHVVRETTPNISLEGMHSFKVNEITVRSRLGLKMRSAFATIVKQQPAYDLNQLLGEVGGSWGLFLGASVMTVVDMLRHLASWIHDRVDKMRRPQGSPEPFDLVNSESLAERQSWSEFNRPPSPGL